MFASLTAKIGVGVIAVLLITIGYLGFTLDRRSGQLSDMTELRMAERSSHQKTQDNFRLAMSEARVANLNNLLRVVQEQSKITEGITDEYQANLADVRRRADAIRLRFEAAAATGGNTGGQPMPGLSESARAADEATRKARLSLGDRLTATETALQLVALQKWVRGQSAVATNPAP